MLELPFFDLAGDPPSGSAMIDYLEARMPRLLADARRLVEAGWEVAVTGTGLRVRPPAAETPDGDPADTIPPMLDALGVQSDHRSLTPRTISEIEAEMEWCQNLTRYWDAELNLNEPTYEDYAGTWWERGEEPGWREDPDYISPSKFALAVRQEFEARYKRYALPANGWEGLQRLRERLAALRWATGRPQNDSLAWFDASR